MSNDYEGAVWADRHTEVSTGLAHLFDELAQVFETLHAIEYDAPWDQEHGQHADPTA